jgi:hypothetical protein
MQGIPALKPTDLSLAEPLDSREYKATLTEAQTYAATMGQPGSTAYAGQALVVVETGKRYIVDPYGDLIDLTASASAPSSSAFSATITGTGSQTSFPLTHGLNSLYVTVSAYLEGGTVPVEVKAMQTVVNANSTSVVFSVAPDAGDVYTIFIKKAG